MRFTYVSSVSSFVQGAISLTPEFDPHGDKTGPPLSLAEMLNKEGAVKGNVWTNCNMSIPSKHMGKKKFVRAGHKVTLSAEHLRQTDLATLYVSLYNIVDIEILGAYGELFVEYDVTLSTPNFQFQNVKSLVTQPTVINLMGDVSQHAPIYMSEDWTPGEGPQYLGGEHSTLGLRHDVVAVGTTGGAEIESTRIYFDEPFHGKMIWVMDDHSGGLANGIPVSALPKAVHELPDLVYHDGYEPASLARQLRTHTHSTASPINPSWDLSGTWDIVAKAGDVLDFAFDAIGLVQAGRASMTFTDMAMGLLDIALLL